MKIINGLVYTDKQYIELLEKLIKEINNSINEVVDDLQKTIELNEHIKIGNNELVQLDIDHIKYLINKLKGEKNEE